LLVFATSSVNEDESIKRDVDGSGAGTNRKFNIVEYCFRFASAAKVGRRPFGEGGWIVGPDIPAVGGLCKRCSQPVFHPVWTPAADSDV